MSHSTRSLAGLLLTEFAGQDGSVLTPVQTLPSVLTCFELGASCFAHFPTCH